VGFTVVKASKTSKQIQLKERVSSVERRRMIIAAAVPLFAQEGFRGVTTKRLARQAGVSEALLYQHFPSKDELYAEVQRFCCNPSEELRLMLAGLKPSTQLLVQLLFFMTKAIVEHVSFGDTIDPLFPRLMLHSLLDDGAFARAHFDHVTDRMVALIQRCIAAARAAGDLVGDEGDDDLLFWFCHHTLVAINMYQLPHVPVVAYHRESRLALTIPVMRYMLRGIGLTPQATKKYVDFNELSTQVDEWIFNAGKGTA